MINDASIEKLLCKSGVMLLKADFKQFIRVFHYRRFRKPFIFKPFHIKVIKALEGFFFGKNIKKNLVINIPVRWGKSIIVQYYIAWTYANNPNCNNIYTSYSDELVLKFSSEIKDILNDPLYQTMFGVSIRNDAKSKSIWKIQGGGETRATSLGGAITGFGAGTIENGYGGAIFVDDPLKAGERNSETAKKNVNEYFDETLASRKNNQDTPFVIIMQRLAVDDLVGYIQSKYEDDFEFIVIPALNKETGESEWQEKISTANLLKMKDEKPFFYASQMQQSPVVEGGNLFKKEMFEVRPQSEFPKEFDYTFCMGDTAYKSKEINDFNAIAYLGVEKNILFIQDLKNIKCDAVKTEEYFIPFIEKCSRQSWNFRGAFIEDKGHGIYLNQLLRESGIISPSQSETEEFFKDRRLDKVERAMNVIPRLTAVGKIVISDSIPEDVRDLIMEQCLNFPDGKHDDIVDVVIDSCKYVYCRNSTILDVL